MPYIVPSTIDENDRIFINSLERTVNDEIFGPTNDVTIYGNITKESNKFYKMAPYTRHVFSHQCPDIYFMDDKNIPLPACPDNNLHMFGTDYIKDNDKKNNNVAGVYIVERYTLISNIAYNCTSIITKYKNDGILTDKVLNNLYKELNTSNPNVSSTIRIVTFIPNIELLNHKYIYSEHTNLYITKGLPDNNVIHPKSKKYINSLKIKNLENEKSNITINIDIVDNDNRHKPYYLQIGNRVEKIYSYINSTKKSGVDITIKKNDMLIVNESYKLKDINNIGVYDKEDDAKFNGDIENKIKYTKLEIEKKKLDITDNKVKVEDMKCSLETDKVVMAYTNMENDRFNMLLDKEMKLHTFKHSIHKNEIEHLGRVLDFTRDKLMFDEKLKSERIKTAMTILTTLQGVIKMIF